MTVKTNGKTYFGKAKAEETTKGETSVAEINKHKIS